MQKQWPAKGTRIIVSNRFLLPKPSGIHALEESQCTLIRPGRPVSQMGRSLSAGAAPLPIVCWAARTKGCTAIARAGPAGRERTGFTLQPLSRDFDPGKPDQKPAENPDWFASFTRGHKIEGLGGSAVALPFTQERERPAGSRRVRGGRGRPLRNPNPTAPGATRPAKGA